MVLIIVHLDQKSKIAFLGGVIEGGGRVRKITPQLRYPFEVSNFDWPLTTQIEMEVMRSLKDSLRQVTEPLMDQSWNKEVSNATTS